MAVNKRVNPANTRRYTYEYQDYTEGNTVRHQELMPTIPKKFDERRRKEEERRRRQAERTAVEERVKQIRRNARTHSFGYMLVLGSAVLVLLSSCVFYLYIQSSMNQNGQRLSDLQAEYEMLKTNNEAAEADIESSIDYEEIYRIATEELGLVYPKKHQVVQYDSSESEYVRQNDNIP